MRILILIAALLLALPAHAEPKYRLDRKQTRVIAISNLSPGGECHPFLMTGRVVMRGFDDSGARPISVTVEDKDGERSLINIEPVALDNASMVTVGWVNQGLEMMLKEGRRVSMRVKACGAAGRFLMLDAVRPQ